MLALLTVTGASNHFGQHGDQLLVEGDPVVSGGRFGAYPRGPRFRGGEDLDPLRLGLRGPDHLRKELLLAKLGVAFGHLGLFGEDLLLRSGSSQGTSLSCLRLGGLHFGVVLGPGNRGLTRVLRLIAVRLLAGLSSGLIRRRLGDGRGLVDRGDVRLAQSLDITRALIVDRFNLQGVNYQTQGGHLWLRLIENFRGELLSFSDQILDGHRADDGAEMTGENPPGQTGHLVLVGEEACPAFVIDSA